MANLLSSSSLIVVSNRLPFVLKRNETTNQLERKSSAGGLVTAVAPVVVECQGLWIGWPGIHLDNPKEPIPENPHDCTGPTAGLLSKQVAPVHVNPKVFDDYYNGCCNGTFWPLFHSMPDRALFEADKWEAYTEVNRMFADATIEAVKNLPQEKLQSPLLWIHDYHLMTCPILIREALEDLNIACNLGFFLHIPFPPWDIFRLFPWDDEVLQGILGCDIVGFHIEDYCLNFIDCCQRRLGCRVDRTNMLVEIAGRTVRICALPIGIPYDRFAEMATKAPCLVSQDNRQLILGVDRLDYTKGLVHRLKAFERLLEKFPEHIDKVTFLQVAVPSRTDVKEYQCLKEEIDQLIGRINGKFSSANWSPIRYIYGCVSQENLAAYYRDASVGLVTPLRDGMNLVAKEFVACQVKSPGVLIVSPFAGAGLTMHEALSVNPYEINESACMIHRALKMPEDERKLRMNQLQRREQECDVTSWMKSFFRAMGALQSVGDPDAKKTMLPFTFEDFDQFFNNYIDENSKLALLLDYDGTLAPIAPRPELAIMPEETRRVLEKLSNNMDVQIAIISGRSLKDVKDMVNIEGITYAGNHGFEILQADGTRFMHPIPPETKSKLDQLQMEIKNQYCVNGAWLEDKGVGFSYHYRGVEESKRPDLKDKVRKLIRHFGFKPFDGDCVVEAKPQIEWDKGRASLYILRTMFGLDWAERIRVIYVGDDVTDEDAMRALKGIACTFRVTSHTRTRTAANRRLPGPDSVLTMLKWIEKRMSLGQPRSRSNSMISNPRSRSNSNTFNNGSRGPPASDVVFCESSFNERLNGSSRKRRRGMNNP